MQVYERREHFKPLSPDASPNFSEIFIAEKNPDILVKEFTQNGKGDLDMGDLDLCKRDYQWLNKEYGSFIPLNQMVEYEARGKKALLLAIERVYATPLNKQNVRAYYTSLEEFLVTVTNKAIQELHGKISRDQNGIYALVPDINERNIMYGTTATNKDPHIYLIDLFPTQYYSARDLFSVISNLTKHSDLLYNFPNLQKNMLLLNNYIK